MEYSNLSRIKPKLRTQGNVTGNFGRPKSKGKSKYSEIGVTKVEHVRCVTQEEYLQRMIDAYTKTTDKNLKLFIMEEIRRIKVQRGEW